MKEDSVVVRVAGPEDEKYAAIIAQETEASAVSRGTGISRRSPASIVQKMQEGKAVIAVTATGEWAGFSCIETWGNNEFVSNSGLIVSPKFRKAGIATRIKRKIFRLSRTRFPLAKVFTITTALAVMKLNARLGFDTVTFNEITHDRRFWEGCKSCVNYGILQSKDQKHCLCTAMLYIPKTRII